MSGKMKKRILGLAEVIYILRTRSAATGDALFLQKENTELEAKLRASRAAETRLKEDVKSAEGVIKELRKEAKELRERMGSESPSGGNEGGTRTGEAVRGHHRDPTPSQQDAETDRLIDAITACDKRIDFLIDLRETGRERVEERMRTRGGKLPPPAPRTAVVHQRLLPRKKGRLSKGILSTETESEAVSEGERYRPREKITRPPLRMGDYKEYGNGEHGRGRRGEYEGPLNREGGHTPRMTRRRRPPPPAAVTLKPMGGGGGVIRRNIEGSEAENTTAKSNGDHKLKN